MHRISVPWVGFFFIALALSGAPLNAGEAAATVVSDLDEEAVLDVTLQDSQNAERPFNEFIIDGFVNITLHADLRLYHIRTNKTYHTDDHNNPIGQNAAFTEITARFGADFSLVDSDWLSGQIRIVGTEVDGRPENWTFPRGDHDWGTQVDLANVKLQGDLGGMSTSLTVGLQELSYGDGLLIYDGISEKRAIWTTPLRSFRAVKWTIDPSEACSIDLFAAEVDDSRLSYEAYLGSGLTFEGGGELYGANVNCPHESLGTFDVGLFYKDEDISANDAFNGGLTPDSDTWALSVRDSKDLGQFNVTGEIVKQWGRTRVAGNGLPANASREDRDSWGGHLSLRYNFEISDLSPYLTARYAYFQGDDNDSSDVESFDPFYYGFADWGYWYLGDMTSYSLTNTNERAASLEFGFFPTVKTKLRVLLYNFMLDEKTALVDDRSWSNEVNIVFDYYPCDYVFLGLMTGAVVPGAAAEDFYGDNETQTEVMAWVGLYF